MYNICDPTYFDKIYSGEINFYEINGITYGIRNYMCDICLHFLNNEMDNTYYYCLNCKSNICSKCFGNTDNNCYHEKFAKRYYYISDNYVCDLCYKSDGPFFSKCISKNDYITVNICEDCSETHNGKYFIFMFNLIKTIQIQNDPLIGDINDWLPIFKTFDGYLLINTNSKSIYFNQLATICIYNGFYYFHSYYYYNNNDLDYICNIIDYVGVEEFMKSQWIKFRNFSLLS